MKVILQQNIHKLGKVGDVVEAAPGYFRNYLQPRGLAVVATAGTMKKREEDLEALRKKAEAEHEAAVALAARIGELGTLKLQARVGEGGRLFGKVTNKEIAAELADKLGVAVDKRLVKPLDDISSLGSFRVQVRLTPEVHCDLTVEVAAQAD